MAFSSPSAAELLQELKEFCLSCEKCSLRKGCTQVVFGEGNQEADLMLIGEGPGAKEDELGKPFVGAAGELLTNILAAVNLTREDVYIANILKCRPPNNRPPKKEEAAACLPYLEAQVAVIKPKLIVCLGATAVKYFLGIEDGISSIRGKWLEKKGLLVIPTFHPAALLRDPAKKKPVWEDFKKIKEKYEQLSPNS